MITTKGYLLLGLTAPMLMWASGVARNHLGPGGEEEVSISSLPAPVVAGARPFFGDLSGCKASHEVEDGRTEFEVEGEDAQGTPLSVSFSAEGGLLKVERRLDESKLPQGIRDSLHRQFPGAPITAVEAVELHYFEVGLRVDGKKTEVLVTANSQVLSGAHVGEDEERGREAHEEDEDND